MIKFRFIHLTVSGLLLLLAQPLNAEIELPSIFGDNMVLQREMPVPVWGWAEPGEAVTVSFYGQSCKTVADERGNWRVELEPMDVKSQGSDFVVEGANHIRLKNVVVGEVWLCSGQSNMEWPISKSDTGPKPVDHDQPEIRFIKIHKNHSGEQQKDIVGGIWKVCTPETAPDFSAVGIYFARRLQEELDVPIGLIGSYWGGTRIETWISPLGFSKVPSLNWVVDLLNRIDPVTGHVYKSVEEGPSEEELIVIPNAHQRPMRVYNAMIAPLVSYAMRGIIWYQGEGNGEEDDIYYTKMKALIVGWRELWDQGEFPFYFVQLANYKEPTRDPAGGDGWSKVREAQRKSLRLPNTGMALAIDLGQADDIHPRNKTDVGERLALWALAKDYDKNDLVYSGPLYRSMEKHGDEIHLHFDHVGSGLIVGEKKDMRPATPAHNGKLARFAIAGEDQMWHWADAEIVGNVVVVRSSKVPNPVAVRYAYSMNPTGANLYNKEGLPASPFRTDSW